MSSLNEGPSVHQADRSAARSSRRRKGSPRCCHAGGAGTSSAEPGGSREHRGEGQRDTGMLWQWFCKQHQKAVCVSGVSPVEGRRQESLAPAAGVLPGSGHCGGGRARQGCWCRQRGELVSQAQPQLPAGAAQPRTRCPGRTEGRDEEPGACPGIRALTGCGFAST